MDTKSFKLRFFVKETAAMFVALCGELGIDVEFYKDETPPVGDYLTPEDILEIYVVKTQPILPTRKRELIAQWAEVTRKIN